MLRHTTYTLAAKLAEELDIGLKKVVISSGEYLLGKIRDKMSDTDSDWRIPAMSIFRTNLEADYEAGTRPFRERSGQPFLRPDNSAVVLYTIPVKGSYSFTVLVADIDTAEKTEGNLLWFIEDEEKTQLPIRVTIQGEEVDFPAIQVSPLAGAASLTRARQEEWEGGELYRIEFELTVTTFLLKSEIKPIIRTIGLDYISQGTTIILDSQTILAED